jgi:hypothetical protein
MASKALARQNGSSGAAGSFKVDDTIHTSLTMRAVPICDRARGMDLAGDWGVVEGGREYSRIGSPRRGKVDRI